MLSFIFIMFFTSLKFFQSLHPTLHLFLFSKSNKPKKKKNPQIRQTKPNKQETSKIQSAKTNSEIPFVSVNHSWAWGLPCSMVNMPSDTPVVPHWQVSVEKNFRLGWIHFPLFMLRFCLTSIWASTCMLLQTALIYTCLEVTVSLESPMPLPLTIFYLLFCVAPWALRGGVFSRPTSPGSLLEPLFSCYLILKRSFLIINIQIISNTITGERQCQNFIRSYQGPTPM